MLVYKDADDEDEEMKSEQSEESDEDEEIREVDIRKLSKRQKLDPYSQDHLDDSVEEEESKPYLPADDDEDNEEDQFEDDEEYEQIAADSDGDEENDIAMEESDDNEVIRELKWYLINFNLLALNMFKPEKNIRTDGLMSV